MEDWIYNQLLAATCPLEISDSLHRLYQLDDATIDTYGSMANKFRDQQDKIFVNMEYYRTRRDEYRLTTPQYIFWDNQYTKEEERYNQYPKFGHEALDLHSNKAPLVTALFAEENVNRQFEVRYGNERPAYSTPEIFTEKMQSVYDIIYQPMEQKLLFYRKIKELFNEEMGTAIRSTFSNKGDSTDTGKDLPDIDMGNIAHITSKNDRNDSGERVTYDNTIATKLSNMLSLANVDLNIIPSYLASYSHLFMRIVV